VFRCINVHADEGGTPFWLSGQSASLSAVPATPGWSLTLLPYYYNASSNGSSEFQRGGTLASGLNTQVPLLIAITGYAPEIKILGGQPFLSLGFGVGNSNTQVNSAISISSLASQRQRSDSITGGTDLYPYASLAWSSGNHNWMTYLTGDIPTGAYNSQRLSNVGIGHGAVDIGGGYTYLNQQNGHEFSAVLGFTFNTQNPDTHYTNGVDSHIDWALSQFLSAQWHVGVVGYVYYQLSADSYPTNGAAGALRSQALGSFKSHIAAAGPEVGYVFKISGKPAYANLRAYGEFWAQNRVQDYAVIGTLNIPFGGH
jgi:hypothetical protein